MIWLVVWTITFLIIFRQYLRENCLTCTSKVCLIGKTALITGGNSGLGLKTAVSLASRGCTIIIADKDDSRYTVKAIQKETKNPNVTSIRVDMSSFESVRNFAKIINESLDQLNILILSANFGSDNDSEMTQDGLDKMMQVNYFSNFLLIHLLADLLKKSSPARILHSNSITAYMLQNLTLENMKGQLEKKPPVYFSKNYANSKLSSIIASKIFAEKFKSSGVTSNCFYPWVTRKDFEEKAFKGQRFVCDADFWFLVLADELGITEEQASESIVHLAIADQIQHVTGQFFLNTRKICQPNILKNKEFCNEFWKTSEKIVGLTPDEILL